MAFDTLPPLKINSASTGQEFIFSDYIAVFDVNEPVPRIYKYSQVTLYVEKHTFFLLSVENDVYHIGKECFTTPVELFHFRALVEGGLSDNEDVEIHTGTRILPSKNLYRHIDYDSNMFKTTGGYSEREINSGNLVLMNNRMGRMLWLIALAAGVATFTLCYFIGGHVEQNWFYYGLIALFFGIGVSVVIYLICVLMAKFRFSEMYRSDPAMSEDITFVISTDGFAAVESCVLTGCDLIPWSEGNYYIETNYIIMVVLKEKNRYFWVPKRLFPKDAQGKLSEFFSVRLPSR